MCTTCGCSSDPHDGVQITDMRTAHKATPHTHHDHHHHDEYGHEHTHSYDGEHHHAHDIVHMEQDILQKNQRAADHNRGYFNALGILTLNLVSSPGSGKTTLLEKTITDMKNDTSFYVIEGDQQTTNDAARIHALGVPSLQINTGKGCHLDADMVRRAVQQMKPTQHAILLIENVGNLVCPAMFDLGEKERIVVSSVTEGDDKPLKYPDMFHSSSVCVINKIDLLPYLNCDIAELKDNARKVNPHIRFFELSATTGEGMQAWCTFLREGLKSIG